MKNKFVIAVLSLFFVLTCALGVTACSSRNNDSTHTHNYVQKYDDSNHWMECSVSGCTEKLKDRANHDTSGVNGACSVCGYKKSEQENPPTPPAHKHTYSEQWASAGAEGHYHLANCEHTDEHTDIVPHVYDNETDTTCNDCGYVREVVIPHTHDLIPTEANAATCTTDGNIEYWYCADCQKYFSDGNGNTEIALADTVIDKLNHDIEHHNGQAATCTVDGWNAYDTCKRAGCNYTTYSLITKFNHDLEHVYAQAPTCASVGWDAYDYCKREDCSYTTKVEKPATGTHTGGTATCTAKAICEICHNEYGEIDANNHDIEHHNAQAATCTADGWNAYDTCKRGGCNYTTKTTIPQLGHNFATEFTTDKEPTCTEDGSKSKHCSRCEATTEVTIIPANGHGWDEGEVTKEPNCTETGEKTFTCSVCQDTRIEEIAALGHDYATEFTTDKEPTCTENGSTSKHCSRCEATTEVTVILANGHSWNNGEVTKEATCTETGVKTFTCSVCQDTRTEEIAALGHDYATKFTTDKEATCTEAGSKSKHCSRCDSKTEVTVIPANGHSWNNGEVTKEAICTETGVKTFTCSVCQDIRMEEIAALGHNYATEFTTDKEPTCTEEGSKSKHCSRCEATTEETAIPANGHSWNNGEVTKEPTCTELGVKTFTCLVCQAAKTEGIAALGHEYATEFMTDKEPTCTEEGSKSKHCSRCEATTEVTVIPASGHSWDNGEVTKEPTCTELGVKTFTCLVCQTTRTEEVAILEHTKGEAKKVVDSTCTEQGYTIYLCDVCGNTFNADYLPALGHGYNPEWICVQCGYERATDGLVYQLSQDATYYAVVGYTGSYEYVVIPQHYNNVPVTTVGVDVFKNNLNIRSVYISKLIQSIGESAFIGCNLLEEITLPFVGANKDETNNTHFGYIFGASSYSNNSSYVPTSLKTVIVMGGMINDYAFEGCSNLTSVIIEGVSSIGAYAFSGCNSLTSIEISTSVTSIGNYAFNGCSSLTCATMGSAALAGIGVIIGNKVTRIENGMFAGCSGLTSVTIGDSVTSIGISAFNGCNSLESIILPFIGESKNGEGNAHLGYIFGTSNYLENSKYVPKSLKSVTITGGENIGDCAFLNCSSLLSITIPNSVTSIGVSAFAGCSRLTSIRIHNGVKSIGGSAFKDCSSLTSMTLPNSATDIGISAFYNCSSLESITLSFDGTMNFYVFGYIFTRGYYSDSTKYAQYVPKSLKFVTITSGECIKDYAFYNCSSLMSIMIPNSVTKIGYNAFLGCSHAIIYCEATSQPSGWDSSWSPDYCSVVWNCKNNDKDEDGYAYTIVDGVRYSLKDSVAMVRRQSAYINGNITILASVRYGQTYYRVTSIENNAFNGCNNLMSIVVANSVTSIADFTFSGCSGLTSVIIGSNVRSIGSGAFDEIGRAHV